MTLTYEYLLKYYLKDQTTGRVGAFNKKYFPVYYQGMLKQLKELEEDRWKE